MFQAFPAHHQELNECSGSLWFYLRIVVIVVFLVGPATNTVILPEDVFIQLSS
jgi:hypothetical protein